jgi:hypothetical protein
MESDKYTFSPFEPDSYWRIVSSLQTNEAEDLMKLLNPIEVFNILNRIKNYRYIGQNCYKPNQTIPISRQPMTHNLYGMSPNVNPYQALLINFEYLDLNTGTGAYGMPITIGPNIAGYTLPVIGTNLTTNNPNFYLHSPVQDVLTMHMGQTKMDSKMFELAVIQPWSELIKKASDLLQLRDTNGKLFASPMLLLPESRGGGYTDQIFTNAGYMKSPIYHNNISYKLYSRVIPQFYPEVMYGAMQRYQTTENFFQNRTNVITREAEPQIINFLQLIAWRRLCGLDSAIIYPDSAFGEMFGNDPALCPHLMRYHNIQSGFFAIAVPITSDNHPTLQHVVYGNWNTGQIDQVQVPYIIMRKEEKFDPDGIFPTELYQDMLRAKYDPSYNIYSSKYF